MDAPNKDELNNNKANDIVLEKLVIENNNLKNQL